MTQRQTAIAQDWLAVEAGAESVAIEFARMFPEAPVFTTFFDPALFDGALEEHRVHTWPLQRIPNLKDRFRALLPLYPIWFSMLDLRAYDLVISSSVAFTHAVRTSPKARHIAYVYTPLRYAWDLDAYLDRSSWSGLSRLGAKLLRPALQRWDIAAASRPDTLVAISEAVRERIHRTWHRDSEVIYPPVHAAEIPLSGHDDGYFLVAARMLAYRRLDIAVEACSRSSRRLLVVGDGPERARLEAMAGPTVKFLGRVGRPELLELFARCSGYLVPGVEDFGIAPVEAMAAGKPVVGLRAGGVAETVLDGQTGLLFDDQNVDSMRAAIDRLDTTPITPVLCRERALEFDTEVFVRRWRALLARPTHVRAASTADDDTRNSSR